MADSVRGWLLPETFPLLARLNTHELDTLCFAARVRKLNRGDELIREGAQNHFLHFVVEGEFRVLKETAAGVLEIGRLRAPVIVGETSIIDGTAANATLLADSDRATVVSVSGGTVHQLMVGNAAWTDALIRLSREYLMLRALRTNPVLSRLPQAGDAVFLREAVMITLLRGHSMDGGVERSVGGWLVAKGAGSLHLGDDTEEVGAGCFALARERTALRAISDLRVVLIPESLLEVWKEHLGLEDWPLMIDVHSRRRLHPPVDPD